MLAKWVLPVFEFPPFVTHDHHRVGTLILVEHLQQVHLTPTHPGFTWCVSMIPNRHSPTVSAPGVFEVLALESEPVDPRL